MFQIVARINTVDGIITPLAREDFGRYRKYISTCQCDICGTKRERRDLVVVRHEDGRYDQDEWDAFINKIRTNAVDEKEVCPESCDSSILFTFEDGSTLYVANPQQVCYSGNLYLNW